ncbi:MAG TPA: xanthine dehydrogenase family protein subunit M [Gaiellaceae bacterium]|nr:xanthine dehydrogenase family protein subunit M [Gaiellaceae bacterium]
MIPPAFDYARAGSVGEAIELLGREDAKLLAGGHSLIPLLRMRFARPSLLVDIGRLDDLRYVRDEGDAVAIGALTRHADLVRDPVIAQQCILVAQAAGEVGDPQVRHRGTVGGSIVHADPASDLPAVMLTLDAVLVAEGPAGERRISAEDFFTGPFDCALGPQELLRELRVPKIESGVYLKHVRRAQDWATVAVAAARVGDGVNVGLAGMGATPLRARATEQALADGAAPADAAALAAEGTDPPSDISGSAEYRSHLARVLTRQALERL